MKVFIGDLRLHKEYDIESGPFMNFVVSISPVVNADSLELVVDHKKGIQQHFVFKGDYCDHTAIADAFEEIAKKLREKYDDC